MQQPDFLTIPASELAQASRIPLTVLPDLPALFLHFARAIASEIAANNAAGQPTRLILPVGPVDHYPLLVQICNQQAISWQHVFSFSMDEYCDWQGRAVPREHPLSFAGFIQREVFGKLQPALQPPTSQVHFPDPRDLDAISHAITAVGGIDTCYGGVGYHGHVAFNEPPISRWYSLTPDEFRNSLTRLVELAPETVVLNSARATGGNPAALPPMAVTLGMRDIWQARRIRFYCQGGPWQRTVLRLALFGAEQVAYPVTLLQQHPDIAFVTDLNTAQPPLPQIAA